MTTAAITFAELDQLRGGRSGTIDTVCPLCGPARRSPINRRRPVLRTWMPDDGFVSYRCARCGAKGYARAEGQTRRSHALRTRRPDADDDGKRRQLDKARRLWRASEPSPATPVETYLRSRGIIPPLPATVRYLPPRKPGQHPAMIVPYGLPDEPEPNALDIAESAISAVQLTLLNPDGTGKAEVAPNKITVASPPGPMVLAPPNNLLGMAITEGIEDALAAHAATGLGAWSSGGAPFLPRLAAAVPDYVEAVTIYAHTDEAGQRGAHALAEALASRGFEIFIEGLRP